MKDLSFIIPVYNTEERKIERCINSIRQIQSIQYEIIIVDDGSTKEIESFLRYIEQAHKSESNGSIKYIRKENEGVSKARNVGMMATNSKWLLFVDADDEIDPDFFINGIGNYDKYDMVLSNLTAIENGKEDIWRVFSESGIIDEKAIISRMAKDGKVNGPICKLIKRRLIENGDIQFNENMVIGEDADFLLQIIRTSPLIYFDNRNSYFYHREKTTGIKRLKSNKELVISNTVVLYRALKETALDKKCDHLIVHKIEERVIKQLFNIVLELVLLNEYDDRVNGTVVNQIKQLELMTSTGCLSCARLLLMKYHNRTALMLAAKMRDAYQRIK